MEAGAATYPQPSPALIGLPIGALVGFLLLALVFVLVIGGANNCGGGPPTGTVEGVPARYVAAYRGAASKYKLGPKGPSILAAIHKVETNFGRSTLPGVHAGTNSAGAAGPMQFLAGTWASYGVDGDGDGTKDVYDNVDAIYGAANYLRASGAPQDWHSAILAYNHAEWYVAEVLAYAQRFEGPSGAQLVSDTASGASDSAPIGPIFAAGDSVMLRSEAQLKQALGTRLRIDAAVGRQPEAIIDALARRKAHGGLPSTVIVQAGNNGPLDAVDGDRLKRLLRGIPNVILVTVRVERPWEGEVNAELHRLAASWPEAQIADWNAVAQGHPEYLADGVHPSARGSEAYAETIAAAAGAGGPVAASSGGCASAATGGSYVNPFRDPAWSAGRTDQGVDSCVARPAPVLAIGDAQIIGASPSGWGSFGWFLWYRLTEGDHAGLYIYVAEHLANGPRPGQRVQAGERIATALPGYPCTEWGFATASGGTADHIIGPASIPPGGTGQPYDTGSLDGHDTIGGQAFARWLIGLGAGRVVAEKPPQSTTGPTRPSGA